MMYGRWPNGWSVIEVSRWLESNFEFPGRFSHGARARFLQRWADQEASRAAADNHPDAAKLAGGNLPEADNAFPEPKLDKHIGEMLGTLKSTTYLEGHLDNYYGGDANSRPDFDALVEAHHGTKFIHGSLAASILGSDADPQSFKENGGGGLGSVSASAFVVGDNDPAGHQLGPDSGFPFGTLPPADLGPPPVI